ncbi:hypothetical protein [Streptomyces sp. NPDC055006]
MADRLRIKWDVIHELLKSPEMAHEIKRHTREIDANATALGSQTRVDFSADGERARGAVIAGYEDGASAANSRAVLLRSLGGGAGA